MALTAITISVNIDTTSTQFVASANEETNASNTLVTAVDGLMAKMVARHDQLQGIPDSMLSEIGKEIRDTPLAF